MTDTHSGPTWQQAGAGARRLARDPASVLLICQVIGAAVAFVINILAARALEPSGRGELALLLQIAYLSSLGLLLGTDRSIVTVYTGSPVRIVTRSFVRLLATPSALCLVVVVTVLALPVPSIGSWRVGLSLALLFAVTNAFARAVRSIAIAAGRQREFLGYSLTTDALLLLVLGLLFVRGNTDSTTWMLAYVVVGTIPTAVWLGLWIWRAAPDSGTVRIPTDGVRESRREGLQLLPSALAQSGVLRLDRLLLAGLASTAALGMYATVATMTELIAWPLLAFADSRLGAWREAHDRGALLLRKIVVVAAVYSVVAAALVAVAIHLVLLPLLGTAYQPAGDLVVPLAAAAAVFGMAQLLISMLIATRRNALASTVEVVGFGVSIVGYVVLISQYDALGAAYGSLLGYFTCLVGAGIVLTRARRQR